MEKTSIPIVIQLANAIDQFIKSIDQANLITFNKVDYKGRTKEE